MPAGRVRHRAGVCDSESAEACGLKLEDIAVIELNEAFAAQSLAVIQQAGLDLAKVNPNGGAIALGHPLGCTGAKLTANDFARFATQKCAYGMVTMCIGGGMVPRELLRGGRENCHRGTERAQRKHQN